MMEVQEIQEVHNPDTDRAHYVWGVRGKMGGVHVWAQRMNDQAAEISGCRYYGGIEVHRATPSEYDDPTKPDHYECWFINGPCWHDGSSLQFERQIKPMIQNIGIENVASYCLSVARAWYRDHIEATT